MLSHKKNAIPPKPTHDRIANFTVNIYCLIAINTSEYLAQSARHGQTRER